MLASSPSGTYKKSGFKIKTRSSCMVVACYSFWKWREHKERQEREGNAALWQCALLWRAHFTDYSTAAGKWVCWWQPVTQNAAVPIKSLAKRGKHLEVTTPQGFLSVSLKDIGSVDLGNMSHCPKNMQSVPLWRRPTQWTSSILARSLSGSR